MRNAIGRARPLHRAPALRGGHRQRIGRYKSKRAGVAAVELALILPFFAVMTMGLMDFGHLFFVYNTMNNAAREGARRGAVTATSSTIESAAEARAQAYLDAAGLGGGGCGSWCPTPSATLNGGDVVVTVALSGSYQNITGFSYALPGFSSPFSSISNLSTTSTMRWELQ